jgi:hypothetical protein
VITVGELDSRRAAVSHPFTSLPGMRVVALEAAEHQKHSFLVASFGRFAAAGEPAGGAVAIVPAENVGSGTARDEGSERSALWLERVCGGAWTGKAGQTCDKWGYSSSARRECIAMHEDKPKRVLRIGQNQGRAVARHQAFADSVSPVRRTSVRRLGEPALGVMGGSLSAGVLTGAAPGVVAFGSVDPTTTAPAPTGDVVAKGSVARSQSS